MNLQQLKNLPKKKRPYQRKPPAQEQPQIIEKESVQNPAPIVSEIKKEQVEIKKPSKRKPYQRKNPIVENTIVSNTSENVPKADEKKDTQKFQLFENIRSGNKKTMNKAIEKAQNKITKQIDNEPSEKLIEEQIKNLLWEESATGKAVKWTKENVLPYLVLGGVGAGAYGVHKYIQNQKIERASVEEKIKQYLDKLHKESEKNNSLFTTIRNYFSRNQLSTKRIFFLTLFAAIMWTISVFVPFGYLITVGKIIKLILEGLEKQSIIPTAQLNIMLATMGGLSIAQRQTRIIIMKIISILLPNEKSGWGDFFSGMISWTGLTQKPVDVTKIDFDKLDNQAFGDLSAQFTAKIWLLFKNSIPWFGQEKKDSKEVEKVIKATGTQVEQMTQDEKEAQAKLIEERKKQEQQQGNEEEVPDYEFI